MKAVIWTAHDGRKHRSLLPDAAPDHTAPQGVPQDPPPFLDAWEAMGKNLWNELVEAGIIDWASHQNNPAELNHAVRRTVLLPLLNYLKAETRNRPAQKE